MMNNGNQVLHTLITQSTDRGGGRNTGTCDGWNIETVAPAKLYSPLAADNWEELGNRDLAIEDRVR